MIYSAKKPDTFIFFVTRDPSPAEKPFRIAVAAEKTPRKQGASEVRETETLEGSGVTLTTETANLDL